MIVRGVSNYPQSVPLATIPKPKSSKIPFGVIRVPVHFNAH